MTVKKKELEVSKNSESLLGSLLEYYSDPIFSLDNNYRYTSFNNSHSIHMKELYGTQIKVGIKLSDCMTNKEDWVEAKKNIDKALVGKNIDIEVSAGDLKRMYFRISHIPVFSEDKKEIDGVLIISTNLTQLKESENEKQLNEKRLESLVKISNYVFDDIQSIMDYTLSEILSLTESEAGFLFLYDNTKNDFSLKSWSNNVMRYVSNPNSASASSFYNSELWKEIKANKKPVILNNFDSDEALKYRLPEKHFKFNKFLAIPVVSDNEVVALVGIVDKPSDYTNSDIRQLNLMLDAVWKIVIRKQTIDLIEKKDRFNRSLLDNALDGYFVLNSNIEFVDVNIAFCTMVGYSPEELLKMSVYDLDVNFADIQEHRKKISNTGSDSFETQYKCKNRQLIDVEVRVVNLNESYLHFAYIRDITKKKKVELKLIESEERYRSLFQSNFSVMLILDPDTGRIMDANPSACEFYGWSYDEMTTKYIDEINMLPRNEVFENMQCAKSQKQQQFQFKHKKSDGNVRDVEVFATTLKLNKKTVLHVIIHDITDRILAKNSLAESERRFRALLTDVQMISLILDLNGNIVFCNDFLLNLTGWTYKEIIGKNWFEIFIKNEIVEDVKLIFGNAVTNSKIITHHENKILSKLGDEYLIAWNNTAFYDDFGKLIGIASLGVDITEQRKAVDLLQRSKDRLNRAEFATKSGNWELHLDTGIVRASKGAMKIYGLSKHNNEYSTIKTYPLIEYRKLLDEAMAGLIQNDMPYEVEFKIQSGSTLEIKDVHSTAFYDKDNKIVFGVIADITEKKKVEEKFAENRAKLDAALSSMTDAVFISDKNGRYNLFNEAFVKFHKFKSKEECSNSLEEYPELFEVLNLNEEKIPVENWAVPSALRGVSANNKEYLLKRKDSGITWFGSYSYNPIRDENGLIVGCVVVARDITERKKAEQALEDSERKYRMLADNSTDVIWTMNMEGQFLYISPSVESLRGYTVSEVLNQRLDEVLTPESYNRVMPIFQSAIEEAQKGNSFPNLNIELQQICKDGSTVWTEVTASLILDSNGDFVSILGVSRNVSDRKIAEIALIESEAKLSALFSSMTEMVAIHELVFNDVGEPVNYKILECNDAFTKMTGIKKADAIGKLATEVYKSEVAPYFDEYKQVCKTGYNIDLKTYYAPMDMHFVISVVSIAENQFATITTNITDIEKSKESIIEKNKELENYIYVASHDLRSPLVNIQGFSERLSKQTSELIGLFHKLEIENPVKEEIDKLTESSLPKSLNYILTNVSKMDKLINGLLQVSRMGRIQMLVKEVNMSNLLDSIIISHGYQLNETESTVKIENIDNCYGDEQQLNQLFSNIISNAIKYRDLNRNLILEISSVIKFNKIIYRVKDNGIGISVRHIEKIWDVFYRVDSGSEIEGDGLGLSLVRRITDKHKGKIWVESEEGRGSTFFIELNRIEFNL